MPSAPGVALRQCAGGDGGVATDERVFFTRVDFGLLHEIVFSFTIFTERDLRRMFTIDYPPPLERVILAGLRTSDTDPALFDIDMKEMLMLCATAGAKVMEVMIQKRDSPVASTYLGGGKLEEIAALLKEKHCTSLIIDAPLSPGQVRNIEKIIQKKVIDRSQLILDIFAQHARTNEAKIQVELAQMRTMYPRLTHAWTHFSQQVGGIGTRGPGEKQLEVDRRLIQKKISDLTDRLKKIDKSRDTQRKARSGFFKVTLVGYTNVGKSSLLNALSGSDLLVENKLFATLDTATRRTFIPGVGSIVVSDTVGFLRKLPHHLMASFKSTLGVVSEADLLIVVADGSSPWADHQLKTVNEVLDELANREAPRLLVFNKMDLVSDPFERKKLSVAYPHALFVSALSATDMQELKNHIGQTITMLKKEKSKEEIIKHTTREFVKTHE
jgi:GTP-binding protein HflX